ncbi:MAG: trimethylamine methyltransferase family protein, partial [Anaerovoracaceae bacterium]
MQYLKFLSENDIIAVHEATLTLMQNYGVKIIGEEARSYYKNVGCDLSSKDGRVKFPKDVVEKAIETTPEKFIMCGRDEKHDFEVGGDKVCFTNFGTGVEIMDIDTGEMLPTVNKDLATVTRF